ncbi:MAG: type VII toxin-antitoxin system HepT family RNase toxin [Polyangiaceae bacterium]
MTDAELVIRKLAILGEHLARARRRRPAQLDALRADVDLQDSLSLSVLVAIQEAIDIAFHVVSDEGWGAPASYAESFEVLARRGVIEPTLAAALSAAAGLRNRLAHAYATLDIDRLWSELPAGLDALEQYAAAIARFVPPLAT